MNNKNILYLLVILIVIFCIGWFLIWPAWDQVSQTSADLADQQAKLDKATASKQNLSDLQARYQSLKDAETRIMQALPSQADLPGLIVQLEALVSQNGLIMNSIDFVYPVASQSAAASVQSDNLSVQSSATPTAVSGSPTPNLPTPPASIKILVINLNLSGNYNSLKSFLLSVENDLRLTDVTNIDFITGTAPSVKGSASVSGDELSKVQISLNVYYKK